MNSDAGLGLSRRYEDGRLVDEKVDAEREIKVDN
jgi:hypothetical protein